MGTPANVSFPMCFSQSTGGDGVSPITLGKSSSQPLGFGDFGLNPAKLAKPALAEAQRKPALASEARVFRRAAEVGNFLDYTAEGTGRAGIRWRRERGLATQFGKRRTSSTFTAAQDGGIHAPSA
jgi:hypothetical protein